MVDIFSTTSKPSSNEKVGNAFGNHKMKFGNQTSPKLVNVGIIKVGIIKIKWESATLPDSRFPLFPFINIGFYFLILLKSGNHNIYIIFR